MSTVVLYCWCHSDSASVLLYFTERKMGIIRAGCVCVCVCGGGLYIFGKGDGGDMFIVEFFILFIYFFFLGGGGTSEAQTRNTGWDIAGSGICTPKERGV